MAGIGSILQRGAQVFRSRGRQLGGAAAGSAAAAGMDAGINALTGTSVLGAIMGTLYGFVVGDLYPAAFALMDRWTKPDMNLLSDINPRTAMIGGGVVVITSLVQIGRAVWRGGVGFGRLVIGLAQFGTINTGMVATMQVLIDARNALTVGILNLFGDGTSSWSDMADQSVGTETIDAAGGVALGIVAIVLLIPAGFAIGAQGVVGAAGMYIIVATVPILAAGLTNETTRDWFWKAWQWLIALLIMHPATALVMAIGLRLAGTAAHQGDGGLDTSLADLLITGLVMIVSCSTPLVCFKLLAFVEPNSLEGAGFGGFLNATKPTGTAGSTTAGAASTTAARFTGSIGDRARQVGAQVRDRARTVPGRIARAALTPRGQMHLAQRIGRAGAGILDAAGVGHKGRPDKPELVERNSMLAARAEPTPEPAPEPDLDPDDGFEDFDDDYGGRRGSPGPGRNAGGTGGRQPGRPRRQRERSGQPGPLPRGTDDLWWMDFVDDGTATGSTPGPTPAGPGAPGRGGTAGTGGPGAQPGVPDGPVVDVPGAAGAPYANAPIDDPSARQQAAAGFWSEPAPADSWNQPAPAGSWNQPAPAGSWNQPAPAGSWNQPAPAGSGSRPPDAVPQHLADRPVPPAWSRVDTANPNASASLRVSFSAAEIDAFVDRDWTLTPFRAVPLERWPADAVRRMAAHYGRQPS